MELSVPLSQDSGGQPNPIFVDAHGNACKVNVQAVELEGRPRLVRTLKSAGATVISNTKDADIILVDPSTECGRRLIRMWGKDPSKVVLHREWVKLSISNGHPLLQADGWGGMRAVDDGLPVRIDGVAVDEEPVEDLISNPLPTPRITPVDSSMPNPEVTNLPPRTTAGAWQSSTSCAATVPSSATTYTSPSALEVPPSSQDQSPFSLYQTQTGASFPFVTPQTQPHVSPIPNSYGSLIPPPSAFQQAMTLSAPSFYTAFMTMLEVVARSGAAANQVPRWGGDTPESQMYSNIIRSTQPSQPTLSTSSFPLSSQPTLGVPLFPPSHSHIAAEHTVTNGSDVLPSHDHSADDDEHSSSLGADVTNSHPPFVRDAPVHLLPRQSSTEPPSSPVSRKQAATIKAALPPPPVTKRRRIAAAPLNSDEAEPHTDASPNLQDTPVQPSYPSTPPEPARIVIDRRNPCETFSSGGESVNFYVQVDLHRRHNVVSNIKKHKGRIVNNIPDADYVIASTRAKSYDWVLKEATSLGKIPIQTAFVTDCIDENAILDETPYALEAETSIRYVRRGRPGAFSEVKWEKSADKSNKKPRASVVKTEKLESPSRILLEDELQQRSTRGETPPPPGTCQRMSGGKYYFTAEENEYFCQFAQYHLGRDPSMPTHALIQRLCEKMPHHTSASWQNYISQKLKTKLEHIRKRASIAKREGTTVDDQPRSFEGTSGNREPSDAVPYKRRRMSSSPSMITQDGPFPPTVDSDQDPEKDDFDSICSFFASGGGDDDDDERVWQALAGHRPCKTAKSWPEYYAAHKEAVYARIEELMAGLAVRRDNS
ncbi:hypothetical protein M404DRAFT_997263 [Pisolithus tinctorius Marx 270]|uniref:Uncharacterized protein n=1 Tax=Pisolithus tinctorius Marx 270 TaxID=870435 RepID=A0A0C3PIH2_PISTI|nr:hypothetical protein M404DRAFT_997263 [Pisolithus tinctorius Marx 270]